MSLFVWISIVGYVLGVSGAAWIRGRRAGIFVGVLLAVYTCVALALSRYMGSLLCLYTYFHAIAYLTFLMLTYQRMKPLLYRILLGWPGSWFMASTMLAFPWAIAAGLGFWPHGWFVPYLLAIVGFADTFRARKGIVSIHLGVLHAPELKRAKTEQRPLRTRVLTAGPRPLRVLQITDPHLGSFMSVKRLREICERAVTLNPDLILLTGDFLTTDSNEDHSLLGPALAPLSKLPGRCFACYGNHDHESPEHVQKGLAAANVTLLVDQMVCVETAVGPIEILGFDFPWDDRKATLEKVSAQFPRTGVSRIALLHDPGGFESLPPGTADLTLSGHTHGGQLGLLWFGLPHTIVSALTGVPDHGLWSRGQDLLYVHRGTGHYGFPLRLGVPPEESVLEIFTST